MTVWSWIFGSRWIPRLTWTLWLTWILGLTWVLWLTWILGLRLIISWIFGSGSRRAICSIGVAKVSISGRFDLIKSESMSINQRHMSNENVDSPHCRRLHQRVHRRPDQHLLLQHRRQQQPSSRRRPSYPRLLPPGSLRRRTVSYLSPTKKPTCALSKSLTRGRAFSQLSVLTLSNSQRCSIFPSSTTSCDRVFYGIALSYHHFFYTEFSPFFTPLFSCFTLMNDFCCWLVSCA